MPEPVPRRIFVVGCPRSGTTLLQAMIGAHPEVRAFPETHGFRGLTSRNPVLRRLGVRGARARDYWAQLPGLGINVPARAPLQVSTYAKTLLHAMDAAARSASSSAWSEKTPGHLRSLDVICTYAPDAYVVHVVRQGAPTVASLFAVTHEHADAWRGERSIDLCLTRWRNDLLRTARWAGKEGHELVSYEALAAEPDRVLTCLLTALGLAADEGTVTTMLRSYPGRAQAVISQGEAWKERIAAELTDRNDARLDALPEATQQHIAQGVAEVGAVFSSLTFL